jgi:hypothetical protein
MALFGWTNPAVAMRYCAKANRRTMALDAQAAMDWGRTANRHPPPAILGEGKRG